MVREVAISRNSGFEPIPPRATRDPPAAVRRGRGFHAFNTLGPRTRL